MRNKCNQCKFFLRYHSWHTYIDCVKYANYPIDKASEYKYYKEKDGLEVADKD